MDTSLRSDTCARETIGSPDEATAQPLLLRLEGVRKEGDGWRAKCPSCDGSRRDVLSVAVGEKRVLVHCFAGCSQDDVLSAVGLSWKDLQPSRSWPPSRHDMQAWRAQQKQVGVTTAVETLTREIAVLRCTASMLAAGCALEGNDITRFAQSILAIDAIASVFCEPRRHKAGGE